MPEQISIARTAKETTPQLALEALQAEGVLLLRGFVDENEQATVADEVLSHELTPVDRSSHTIPEQFQDTGWDFTDAPPAVSELGRRIIELIQPVVPDWSVNQVRAQLYSPGEAGIEWHRDYKRDLRVIAVASFLASTAFEVKLESSQYVRWTVDPGDLVLLRGSLLNGSIDDRLPHRVEAPPVGQRLSVAYREVAAEVPELEEPRHERN